MDKNDLLYFSRDSIVAMLSNSISVVFQLLHVFEFRFKFKLIDLMYFDYRVISISIIEITWAGADDKLFKNITRKSQHLLHRQRLL